MQRRKLLGSALVLLFLPRCTATGGKTPQELILQAKAIATGVAILAPSFALIAGVPPDKIAEVQSAASLIQVAASSLASVADAQGTVAKIQTATDIVIADVTPYVKDPKTQSVLQDIRLVLPLLLQTAGLFIASAGSITASPEQRQAAVGRLLALRPRP